MGLYDSIMLKVKCPYCKEISEMEFQTKDGACGMGVYKKGDKFDNGQFREIDAIGSCESFTCQFESAKESVWKYGYYGGFSRSFEVKILCKKGKITNKFKIYNFNYHKGRMKGILGELKGEKDNMKVVRYVKFINNKMIDAVYKPMTTNGWLDKFRKESFDGGVNNYKNILYLYNLDDSEEAMKLWFVWRYRLQGFIRLLIKELKINDNEILASIFLSNEPKLLIKQFEEAKNQDD